jgi:tetratricopeptide (TPR) repeat protein
MAWSPTSDERCAAMREIERGRYGKAERLLASWIREHPDDLYALVQHVRCFYRPRSSKRRDNKCDAFYREIPDDAMSLGARCFVRAERYRWDRESSKAVVEYRAAIAHGINDPTAHERLGEALLVTGDAVNSRSDSEANVSIPQTSETAFQQAFRLDPHYVPILDDGAKMLFERGCFDLVGEKCCGLSHIRDQGIQWRFENGQGVIEYLERLLEAVKAVKDSLREFDRGNYSEALDAIWPAFRDHPDNCVILRTLIFLFDACDWLRFAPGRIGENLGGESPPAKYALGLVLWYAGLPDKAWEKYDGAINQGLDNAFVRYSRAMASGALGRESEALADLREAASQGPELACVRAELAGHGFKRRDYAEVLDLAELTEQQKRRAKSYEIAAQTRLDELEALAVRTLLRQRKPKQAETRLASLEPKSRQPDLMLASALTHAASDHERAAKEISFVIDYASRPSFDLNSVERRRLQTLEGAAPKSEAPGVFNALLIATGGDASETLVRLEELTRRFPNSAMAWSKLAETAQVAGDSALAERARQQEIRCTGSEAASLGVCPRNRS